MTKDHFLIRAKDWALLVSIVTVVVLAWGIFSKIVLAQERLSDHEVRIKTLEPAVTELKQVSAVQEAHFQDMISRLDRIEKQTK